MYCAPKGNRRQGSAGKHSFTVLCEYRPQGTNKLVKCEPRLTNYLPEAESLANFKYAYIHIRIRFGGKTIDEYEDGRR